MKKAIKILITTCFLSFHSLGQDQIIQEEVKNRYYPSHIRIGEVDSRLYDSLEIANTQHPSKFYEICGAFIQDSMMNEAVVAFFVGRSRYQFYNKTNQDYEESGDGALAGSFAYVYGEVLSEYLNQNIDNYSTLATKSGDWYQANKYFYFQDSNNDSLYQLQIKGLLNLGEELKNNPMDYINKLEEQRKEIEELLKQIEGDLKEMILEGKD